MGFLGNQILDKLAHSREGIRVVEAAPESSPPDGRQPEPRHYQSASWVGCWEEASVEVGVVALVQKVMDALLVNGETVSLPIHSRQLPENSMVFRGAPVTAQLPFQTA